MVAWIMITLVSRLKQNSQDLNFVIRYTVNVLTQLKLIFIAVK